MHIQGDLFEPTTSVVAFPPHRRVGLIREVASEMIRLSPARGRRYWNRVVASLEHDLAEAETDGHAARDLILTFRDAVEIQIRLALKTEDHRHG